MLQFLLKGILYKYIQIKRILAQKERYPPHFQFLIIHLHDHRTKLNFSGLTQILDNLINLLSSCFDIGLNLIDIHHMGLRKTVVV
jgi:hypothetical protein